MEVVERLLELKLVDETAVVGVALYEHAAKGEFFVFDARFCEHVLDLLEHILRDVVATAHRPQLLADHHVVRLIHMIFTPRVHLA